MEAKPRLHPHEQLADTVEAFEEKSSRSAAHKLVNELNAAIMAALDLEETAGPAKKDNPLWRISQKFLGTCNLRGFTAQTKGTSKEPDLSGPLEALRTLLERKHRNG